jgi:hypothetical protein
MKNISFFLLSFLSIGLLACHKDDLLGTYTGNTTKHSQSTVEVWTSQYSSHFETQYDSAFIQPDVLILEQTGKDSFTLKGQVATYLPFGPYTFNFKDSGPGISRVFKRTYGANGYFSIEVTLTIDADSKTATLDEISEDNYPSSNVHLVFTGSKK